MIFFSKIIISFSFYGLLSNREFKKVIFKTEEKTAYKEGTVYDKNSVYAETINPATAPDKIVYVENDSQYDSFKEYGVDISKEITIEDVTIDSITETWGLADKTTLKRLFILTVINAGESDEEVTNIICPDGKKINLEGFVIGG